MRFTGILIVLVVFFALLFMATNWPVLMTPQVVNLLFVTVVTPLAFVLLATGLGLTLLFFFLALLDRASRLRHVIRLERQLETAQRKLEARRLTELEELEGRLDRHMDTIEEKVASVSSAVQAQLGEHQQALRDEFRDSAGRLEERVLLVRNELAADIHQVEDALKEPREVRQLEGGQPERERPEPPT